MKKYLFLLAIGLSAVVLCQLIPIVKDGFAAPCVTIPIITDEASERVSCKGIIDEIQTKQFVALLQISEDDISEVSVGQEVELHCNALGETVLKGQLKSLSDSAYQTSYGSLKITVVDAVVTIDDIDARLKSGYSVTAEILVSKLEQATILPFEAVGKDGDDYFIYRVENGWAVKETISVAFEDEKGIVANNLDPTWSVCEDPTIYEGDRVKVKHERND